MTSYTEKYNNDYQFIIYPHNEVVYSKKPVKEVEMFEDDCNSVKEVFADDIVFKTVRTLSDNLVIVKSVFMPSIKKVQYNGNMTTVVWDDKTVTTVKAHGEEFSKEHGLAMAIARRYFNGNRSEFLRQVENASIHVPKKTKKKKSKATKKKKSVQ